MSLLMEALKKAEHAKKQSPSESGENDISSLSLSDFPTLDANTTKQEASAPTSLDSEPTPTRQALEMVDVPQEAFSAAKEPTISPYFSDNQKHAQTIFAAKRPATSNRTLIVFGTALIVVTLCSIGGLYYLQKSTQYAGTAQPQQSVFNPVATKPAVDLEESSPVPKTELVEKPAVPISIQEGPEDPSPVSREREKASDQIHIQRVSTEPSVNIDLQNAYQHYSSGDTNAAKALYEKVLSDDANNRDALLGMAAIYLGQNQSDPAAAIYSRLLTMNSSDPDAAAGLAGIKRGDPEQTESQLKKVLASNPQSGSTLFELGNLYMQQSRWSEAQEIYFRAFGTSPQNPDYAFNLAISLDRLGQNKLALDYYQRALALAKESNSKFSQETAKNRIDQLQAVAVQSN